MQRKYKGNARYFKGNTKLNINDFEGFGGGCKAKYKGKAKGFGGKQSKTQRACKGLWREMQSKIQMKC